ncbi:MAG: hypothetical protein E5X87_29805, partial [Mesorhizobium sp.]
MFFLGKEHHFCRQARRGQGNRFRFEFTPHPFPGVDAAPHLPAGILSPYNDGERGAVIDGFRQHPTLQNVRRGCGQLLSPRHYTYRIHTSRLRFAAKLDSISAGKTKE